MGSLFGECSSTVEYECGGVTMEDATATDNDDTATDALQQATATGSARLLLLQKYNYRAQESALASATATDNDDTATDALQQATATGSARLLLLHKYELSRAGKRARISDGDGQRRHGD